jgi:ketosteroid isomerase-like protein
VADAPPTPYEAAVKVFKALQAGDMDEVMAGIHADVVCNEAEWVPFYPGEHRGRDAFLRDVMTPMAQAYELEFHKVELLDAGNTVIGLIELGMTSRATGRTVRSPLVEVYSFTDGLISHLDIYYKDTVELAAAFPEGLPQIEVSA